MLHYEVNKEKLINHNINNKSMLKYPISTILWLSKQSIKDKIQDALKLHNNIDVKLTIIVKDKDGKIIKVHKQKSHSFVANFLYMVGALLSTTNYSWTDISGNKQQFSTASISYTQLMNANCTSSSCGIVIGTGTATPTPNDYKLGNQIANGTGSGQMTYNNTTFVAPSVSGNTTSMTIERTFQNNSGASIIVSEVGIQVYAYTNSAINDYALIVHDLLSSPITVPPNAVLTIVYRISVST